VAPPVTLHDPGASARSTRSGASNAIPITPVSLRAAAATRATLVPWSSSAWMERPPVVTSREAGRMRPANSGFVPSMPLSTIAMVWPAPVLPACQAIAAPCCCGPLERRYSAVSKVPPGAGAGVGVGETLGAGAGAGVEVIGPPDPPQLPSVSASNAIELPAPARLRNWILRAGVIRIRSRVAGIAGIMLNATLSTLAAIPCAA